MQETGLIPGSGTCPGGGNGNPLQYSCLGNPTGQRSLVHGVTKESDTTYRLNDRPEQLTSKLSRDTSAVDVTSITNTGRQRLKANAKKEIDSYLGASLVAQMEKDLPVMQETQVQSLGREDALEKGVATHSSILAWRIPWIEEPGRLYSQWG